MTLFPHLKRIPLYFKRPSPRIDLKEMTLVPFAMIFTVMVNNCMSFYAIEMTLLSYGMLALTILSFLVMAFLTLRRKTMTRYGFLYVLYMVFIITISLVQTTDFKNALYTAFSIWFVLLVLRYYRERPKMLMYALSISLSFCVYVNFYDIATHPDKWLITSEKEITGYLLGNNYNQMGCRLIVALIANSICMKYGRLWIANHVLLAIASIASLAMVGSMTSLSMVSVYVVYCAIPSSRLRNIGLYGLFTVFVLFQVFAVFSGKGLENSETARYIVEDVLHKDITFTQRTFMWDSALHSISKSPLWGWGYVDGDWYMSHMSSFAFGPHNFILSILINGGIILLAIYLAICVTSYRPIHAYRREYVAQTVLFGTVTLWVMSLMEMYPLIIMFLPLMLMYYYGDLTSAHATGRKEGQTAPVTATKKTYA